MCIRVVFGNPEEDSTFQQQKLYVPSKWNPDYGDIPSWALERLERFINNLEKRFHKRRASPNLLPFQQHLLKSLKNHPTLLFPDTDKGLGPCAVTYDQYVEDTLIHLRDPNIYRRLSKEEAISRMESVKEAINSWIEKHHKTVGKQTTQYIRHHMANNLEHPFGQFYIMYKIHKGQKNGRWPTRPVCSDVSSLPHGLGKYITEMLLPVAQHQQSYFRDSYALKTLLDRTSITPGSLLFTSDATAMYTNIKTQPAIAHISQYLRDEAGRTFTHYNPESLIEAIHIVFENNIIAFGDTYWQQISGTGMGISPAPPWATIFYGLYESSLLNRWRHRIGFYRRFIDDVFGIWITHPCQDTNEKLWNDFQEDMQHWHGLEWTCEPLATSVNFMDLTISIAGTRLLTTLYEKPQNLYLYLPPHSSHPRGIETGLIFGQVLRIQRLCSKQEDADAHIKQLFQRLCERGHNSSSLIPIFSQAEDNARAFLEKNNNADTRHVDSTGAPHKLFLHLRYHPEDPPAHEIQQLWRQHVSQPRDEPPLHNLESLDGRPFGPTRLIVAYSRPLNLRNTFSVRNIHNRGREISSYLSDR
eukprot:CCRYP_007965-RA/>CCRYP_007965-RA protein AED:0.02 eAED:0.02 QI:0/-1/0/1/-1/1/1/0/583